ncbi:TPA: hypothetical protein HA318_03060 [Candidatus Micrarchaeota archaeon]|nr:MAG: hypothetical protein AUJ65_01190 [Candidatus Micrarchaeota archaeon CG1_02_51_15]HII38959.1 hypothetical protein [Candidatus Micrarchaeota archaeon]
MGKHNLVSGILVLVVILMIAASTYLVVSYTSDVLTSAVAFASTDQISKLQLCGVNVPAELFKLKADIPNFLLPAIYVGLPSLLIIVAILMFIAGFYYSDGMGGRSHSETVTTTSSPNRSRSGKYAQGRRVEQTRTSRSSKHEGS